MTKFTKVGTLVVAAKLDRLFRSASSADHAAMLVKEPAEQAMIGQLPPVRRRHAPPRIP
jgi:hypothetical protein